MRSYITKRCLLLLPTLFGVSLIIFGIVRMVPGDALVMMMEQSLDADPAQMEILKRQLGLDKPLYAQYFLWIANMARGDFGTSLWQKNPVLTEIARRIPVTLELALMTTIISVLIAIPVGLFSAVRHDTFLDHVVRLFSIGGLSIPNFWLGIMAIVLPSIYLGWTPPLVYIPFAANPKIHLLQFLIPSLLMGYHFSAAIMRMARTALLEVLQQDYIRTARAKGLSGLVVLFKHALKNAMIPILSVTGIQIAFMMGGTVIIEQIFALPGIGRLVLESIAHRDYPLLQGVLFVIASTVIVVNLVVDLLYSFFDPRIRYE